MKLSISKTILSNLLKTVLPAVGSGKHLPVLECVRLETNQQLLTAACTNLELSILAQSVAHVEFPGAICVPVKILNELVSGLTEEMILLDADDFKLTIRGGSKSTLNGISAGEFPPIAAHDYSGTEIDAIQLTKAINAIAFSASDEDARPILQGVCFTGDVMATTDGFRVSVLPFSGLKGLIPVKAMQQVTRLCKNDLNITVRISEGRAFFTGMGWQLATQLIDGTFPDYKAILPKSYKTILDISAQDMRAALTQARAIGSGLIAVDTENGMQVSASTETADTEAMVEATISGPKQKLHFNTAYLTEAVHVAGGRLILSINDKQSPVLITGEAPGWMHVIMPVYKG